MMDTWSLVAREMSILDTHPFLYAPQGVEYIEYPDEGAFSVKLTPQPKKT